MRGGMNMDKPINNSRREQLKDMGKALLAFAAVTLAPTISQAAKLSFAPKGSTDNDTDKTLILSPYKRVGIRMSPDITCPDGNEAVLAVSGNIIASGTNSKVFNAVWNDLAEFRTLKAGVEKVPGKAYVATEEGLVLSTKKAQLGTVGVCSDTYGYALGGKDAKNTIPIGISGWVLAYVDKKYPIGTALVSGPNGVLTKASILDKILSPEKIIGIVENSPASYNNLKIDGRYWVKIC